MIKFQNSHIDPTKHQPGAWSTEAAEMAIERSPELGCAFFTALWNRYPELRGKLDFLRWEGQPEDVYAVYDNTAHGFGVQIDPNLDYIIVWDNHSRGEYAQWNPTDDPVEAALRHIGRAVRT